MTTDADASTPQTSGREERLSVLIVDDEPHERLMVRRLLEPDDELAVTGEAESGEEAIERIRAERPDIVLLDVQMPRVDGFGVLQALPTDAIPVVVFATALDEHAIRAFDVQAIDYVLKPFDRDRFATAIARAKTRARGPDAAAEAAKVRRLAKDIDAARPELTRILVEEHHHSVFVPVETIDWLEADGKYVVLHVGHVKHYVRAALATLERRLPGSQFARLHRSAVVNLDHIAEMRPVGRGDFTIVMASGDTVPLSKRYRARLPELFGRVRPNPTS